MHVIVASHTTLFYIIILYHRHMDCQIQDVFSDCCIFALANATALVHGENPSTFLYNQKERSYIGITFFTVWKLANFISFWQRRGEEEIRKSNLLTQLKFVVTVDTTNFWMCDDHVQYLQRVVSHRSLCFCIRECYRITFKVVLWYVQKLKLITHDAIIIIKMLLL